MERLDFQRGGDDQAVADWLHARLSAALDHAPDRIAMSVPGGSTPFPILERLVRKPLDWDRVDVWPGDDRLVPEDHAASNTGKIRAVLEPAGAHIRPLSEGLVPPYFALVWLGMGEDGHIASLFPNTDPRLKDLRQVRRLTPDPLPPEAPFDRLTMTIASLIACDAMLFVIRGDSKIALFEEAAQGDNDLPIARLLKAARMPVTCFTG